MPATCASRRARTRDWANPKSGWECIPAAAVPNASHIWLAAAALSKSFSLGANDFDGETAERYGYVNRALPDAELDHFVDALALRITSFDRRAIAAAKNLVNQVSLPSADRLLNAITSFETALTWPESQQRIKALLEHGL